MGEPEFERSTPALSVTLSSEPEAITRGDVEFADGRRQLVEREIGEAQQLETGHDEFQNPAPEGRTTAPVGSRMESPS